MEALLSRGGPLDLLWTIWAWRIAVLLLVSAPILAIYLVYKYKVYVLDTQVEIEIARAESRKPIAPEPREIVFNRRDSNGNGRVPREPIREDEDEVPVERYRPDPVGEPIGVSSTPIRPPDSSLENILMTSRGKAVRENAVIEFVKKSLNPDGPGLTVSRWKSEEKWLQEDVEAVLDYFYDLGLITERKNGRACEWVRERSVPQVLGRIYEDQFGEELDSGTPHTSGVAG